MATYGDYGTLGGVKASATLAAKQYHCVKLSSTAGEIKICSSTVDAIIGLVQNDPAAGQPAEVAAWGVALGIAGGSITAADKLTCNKTGELETTTTGGRPIVGTALEAATAQGDRIAVLVSPQTLAD
jgi:hypothetical protein